MTGNYPDARKVMADLADAGISYDDVIAVLEREGVDKFVKSWHELQDTVRDQLQRALGKDAGETPDPEADPDAREGGEG